jgi:hypothetical protein
MGTNRKGIDLSSNVLSSALGISKSVLANVRITSNPNSDSWFITDSMARRRYSVLKYAVIATVMRGVMIEQMDGDWREAHAKVGSSGIPVGPRVEL